MIKLIKVPALSVVSSLEGFRRTDRAWGKKAITVKLSELTEEEIALLKHEPMLIVTEVEVEVDEESTELVELSNTGRIAAIKVAIGQLDNSDAALWKNDGAPNTTAIVALTGFTVSAAERNAAWAEIQAAE